MCVYISRMELGERVGWGQGYVGERVVGGDGVRDGLDLEVGMHRLMVWGG